MRTIQSFSLRHKFVAFPQAVDAIKRMKGIHADAQRTGLGKGLAVLGPSGVGKSSCLHQFIREMQGEDSGNGRILYAEVPSTPSPKSLGAAILARLGDPFAYSNRESAEKKLDRIIQMFGHLKTEVLILDEAQHMVERTRSIQASTADWLKRLVNASRIVIILAGLQRTEAILQPNEQLRRRFSAIYYLNRFDIEDAEGRRNFMGLLKTCESSLPVPTVSLTTPDLARRFSCATYGLIDYLIKILDRAVQLAASRHPAEISMEILADAFWDEVWSAAPVDRNPFHASFDYRVMTGPGEPFEGFDLKAAMGRNMGT